MWLKYSSEQVQQYVLQGHGFCVTFYLTAPAVPIYGAVGEGELCILRVQPEASDVTIADEPEVSVTFMQVSLLVLLL